MILARYTVREMLRRPGRTALTLVGTAIGVAAVVAITITIETTRQAYRDVYASVGGRAALEVVAGGYDPLDPAPVERAARGPGVVATVPVVQGLVALIGSGAPMPLLLLGAEPEAGRLVRDPRYVEGRAPAADDEAAMVAPFAKDRGIGVGSTIRVLTRAGVLPWRVVGLTEAGGAGAFQGGAVVATTLATAQRAFRAEGKANAVQVVLEEGADPAPVKARLAASLPSGLFVQEPAARGALSADSLRAVEQGLSTMSVMSLVAGAFIVLNTLLMNLAERRKQIGVLRAVGTTQRQVRALLRREAAVYGVVGTALGIALGIGMAKGFVAGMERTLLVPLPRLVIGAEPILLAALLGPGTTLLAAASPVRRAARRPPLDALRGPGSGVGEGLGRRGPVVGLALLGVTALAETGFVLDVLPAWVVPPAMAATLVGLVLTVPLFLPLLLRCVRPILSRAGAAGHIAFRALDRRRTRTALTVGVLFLAVVVGIGMGNSILGNVRDVDAWFRRTIVADFFVRAAMPDTATTSSAQVPEEMERQIVAMDGVAEVGKVRFLPARAAGRPVLVIAHTFPTNRPLALKVVEGDPAGVHRGLIAGGVAVPTVLARSLGLEVGDWIEVETPRGKERLPIVGVVTEYTSGGAAIYLEWESARRILGFTGVDAFLVKAAPGRAADLKPGLQAYCREHGCLFQSNADLWAAVETMIGGVTGFLWVLLALVFLVASLGIVNTTTMSVLEQTRELGVLRAVALTRRQTAGLVLREALGLGLMGAAPGVVGGIVLALLFNVATYPLTGQRVALQVDVGLLVGCAVLAIVTALLSAWPAARRAARLSPMEALSYE